MPNVPDRDKIEKQLARELSRLFGSLSGHLQELLEEYGYDVYSVPESFWANMTVQEKAVLLPFLENTSLLYAQAMMETIPIGVDWGLVNIEAANWARSYSTLLAGQIDGTTREAVATSVRNTVASFFEEGLTQPELIKRLEADPALSKLFSKDVKDRLGRVYGPNRAAMIAETETTRAASQGQLISMREIEKTGVKSVAIWHTSADEKVCPICEPLNGKKETHRVADTPYWTHPELGEIAPPPAHVRCRCGWGITFKK